ncbi:MAG: phycobilisome rod-core linker polypeptide [Cyanobacteria bacterium P01_F01_bin.143]
MNISISIDSTVNKSSNVSNSLVVEHYPRELLPDASATETEIVIRAIYRQLLGNAYVMESERLIVAESQLKARDISVREFVRHLAKSELYKSRFIDNCPRYRSHELNFKHILGRAPDGYEETLAHSQILDSQGYEADIDSYVNSDEYQEVFGENIVPYYRGSQTLTGKKLLGYTNMRKMLASISTSDRAGKTGNAPRLIKSLIHSNPDGKVPITDAKELLKELFAAQQAYSKSTKAEFVPYLSQSNPEVEQLDKEIAELEAQLARLQSLSSIGSAGISKWQNSYIDITNMSSSSYRVPLSWSQTDSSQRKKEHIAALKQQIAQASSLAALGEARLNKWRSRFS